MTDTDTDTEDEDTMDPVEAAEAYQAEMEARLRAWRERDL